MEALFASGLATARDGELVEWLGRLGAATAEDVMLRFGLGRTVAYRRLARCTELGLLGPIRLLHGEPALYVATRDGLRWTGLERLGPCRISVGAFAHWQACAKLAAVFGAGGLPVKSERELRVAERERGQLIASVALGGDGRLHRPDLVIPTPERDGRIAVEVELSVKAPRRLEAICRAWARAPHLTGTRYYAAPGPARALRRAVDATHTHDVIEIRALPWANPTNGVQP